MEERVFRAMGTRIRVLVDSQPDPALPDPLVTMISIEAQLLDFERRLSRFRPDSELSRLNHDPREEVPASPLLREAVGAGIWAAERTGGLVDPTLVAELAAAGYADSRDGARPASLIDALAVAPARRPAGPDGATRWRSIRVLDGAGSIRRPPGVMFDSGGVGKGLAADLAARTLAPLRRYAVDVGGDVRVGGSEPDREPIEIEVLHPLSGDPADLLRLREGAVATSGLNVRLWRTPDGGYAHHLIDPSTGVPAWTGVIGATARAPTGLEAEALAKAALLGGPGGAREVLAEHGGLIVTDAGAIERIGPFDEPAVGGH
jgi:thiamine biosynthesis lipoprotein